MCGIVGFLDRSPSGQAEIGRTILGMLNALGCRGPDSAGVALYTAPSDHQLVVRVKLGEKETSEAKVQELSKAIESRGASTDFSVTGPYARFCVSDQADHRQLAASIEAASADFEVVSIGRRLEIVKQVGSPANLEKAYGIAQFRGSHGLGHTRLSTESRVDLSHSQPFWAHGYPDLAVVHNGHITNYHQLRRRYEQRHVRFYTENDSEIIGIYLAEQLAGGKTLENALNAMLRDLDGSYSCLVATEHELAFVKDPFALKPLVFAETGKCVAIATEEIAIRSAVPGDYVVREAQVKEVRVWRQ